MKRIFLALALFCNQHDANSQNQIRFNPSPIIRKWTTAIINIEVRNRNIVSSGTAIFLSYKDSNYLLTARHILYDPFSRDTNKITDKMILIENLTQRDIADKYDSARKTYTWIGDYHFLLFSLKIHPYHFP